MVIENMQDRIESVHNAKIKLALSLYKKRVRDETRLFLIEGKREIERAFASNVVIEMLFFCPDLVAKPSFPCQLVPCSKRVLQKISYKNAADGFVAVARQRKISLKDLTLSKAPLLLVAEGVEKPGNIGALLRIADACNVDAAIFADSVTDLYNPNVVRASTGTLFTVPVIDVSSARAISWLKDLGIQIVATSPRGELVYSEGSFKGSIAIVVGAEDVGLSQLWFDAADRQVRIPAHGVADSLNVAVSAAVLLYEACRQRHF